MNSLIFIIIINFYTKCTKFNKKCVLTEKNESPLKAFASSDKFKIYLSDIGLLRSLSNLDYNEIILDKNKMFKGVLIENYVAC